MKLLFLFIILVIIIYYINLNSNEKFGNVNQFDVLNPQIVKPVTTTDENRLKFENNPPRHSYDLSFNPNAEDIYADKYWLVKNTGFSDIYNYEDIGGLEVDINSNNLNCSLNDSCKTLMDINDFPVKKSKNTFTYKDNVYNLLGVAVNPYYSQYFYIYENHVRSNETQVLKDRLKYMDQLYQYLLIKKEGDKLTVAHEIGPRNKINLNDIVYFSFATFQLGPLNIKKIQE